MILNSETEGIRNILVSHENNVMMMVEICHGSIMCLIVVIS